MFGKFEAASNDEMSRLHTVVQDLSREVSENRDKLESAVNARVKDVMDGLNVATVNETNKLADELKKLSTQVSALEKQLKKAPARKPAASKPAASKTLAKKAEGTVATRKEGKMTVAEKKKAAEAIAKMKPAAKAKS